MHQFVEMMEILIEMIVQLVLQNELIHTQTENVALTN